MPPDADRIRQALYHAVDQSKVPGAVLWLGDVEREYLFEAYGHRQLVPYERVLRKDTLFDIASLTKVVATATAVMKLRDAGLFQLSDSVAEYVPLRAFRPMTIEQLLTHTSGLVPFEHYYLTMRSLDEMLARYAEEGINNPPGVRHDYSDVGFMLLGKVVELAARDTLDAYCAREIFGPLQMTRTAFRPPEAWRGNCAATEDDPWRERMLVGEVHDENTAAVGGVSGQAGLFSCAEDLVKFCRSLLKGQVLANPTVDEMLRLGRVPLYPWQGLAWGLDPWSSKKSGYLPSRTAFGHTGFTGTSIWMDRTNGLIAILLSNAVHPTRNTRGSDTLRRLVNEAIAREFYDSTNSHTGLDRVVRENFTAIEQKEFALLTNHAAADSLGRTFFDVLPFAKDAKLRRIYTPEHGLHGQAEAGERVAGQDGPVPVVSLYGEVREPPAEELNGLDMLIIDLPDVGARYYTYMATMRDCLSACARANVPVLVLDRPNPLGGDVLEGPIARETNSLVCSAAIPIRHGMTFGELAMWFEQNELKGQRLRLSVNWLDSWPRRFQFADCNQNWIPPSPNLPTPESALLYVGMCLFEGTNLNEGRGTQTPFAVVGAPWLDAAAVIGRVAPAESVGARLEAMTYSPESIPGKATSPRFLDEICQGVRIHVTDKDLLRPFTLAVALIVAIRSQHPGEFRFDGSPPFDMLAGGPDLRERIESGASAIEVVGAYAEELAAFDARRPRLYGSDGIPFKVIEMEMQG
jgi:uncharacterized protein YbbC (DUF1343 family)/CubicO group peptidase (beta-lactamase class C family)